MHKFYYPIEIVEMREQGLATPNSATFGRGLQGRLDPGEILGYQAYASRESAIGVNHNGLQSFPPRGKPTPVW